ncbi:CD276 antigen-like isoform X2 [Chaetodon auriga]|uniref:CD276 antigen-like isoform X2 n=1 Tax=Chaetodon auriga TaxID=39042 RepID=UPI0040329DFB
MEEVSCALCLLIGTFLGILAPARGDAEVSCVFMESCVLPCSFQGGSDVVIHWIQPAGDKKVHSYYYNKDQRFRNRTSLFNDQISGGNASLLLMRVEFQDQGRYKCFTSTITGNKESFINLMVDAPVHKVDIQQVENRITCSSEGIYPEPELSWSTSPPSSETFNKTTTVRQTKQQLYNVNSSLTPSDSGSELVYTCTVSTHRNRKRATLRQLPSISGSSTDTRIPCRASNTSLLGFSLLWRFNRSQIILNQTEANINQLVSEQWRRQVKGVSESGGLVLQNLSLKQEGVYTCELSNDEETYVANTFLRLQDGSQTSHTGVVVAVVVAVVLVLVLTCSVLYWRWKQRRRRDV